MKAEFFSTSASIFSANHHSINIANSSIFHMVDGQLLQEQPQQYYGALSLDAIKIFKP
jgi:patatin-like phospholipase/acyl hydrolase